MFVILNLYEEISYNKPKKISSVVKSAVCSDFCSIFVLDFCNLRVLYLCVHVLFGKILYTIYNGKEKERAAAA